MSFDRRVRARMRALAAELGPDDGLTPDELRKLDRDPQKTNRKTLQLCGQVRRALELSLAAAADPVLRRVHIHDVTPDPDASRLRIHAGGADLDPDEALAHLCAALPWLRTEVAHHITRRRTPHLDVVWEGTP